METPLPFDSTVELLINVFLALAMLCIGMSATFADMLSLARDRTRTLRALFANIVVPPVVAVVLVMLLPIDQTAATVLLLLAFAPGGINAVQFSTKAPNQLAAAGELLFLLSLLGLVTAPLAALWLLPAGTGPGLPVYPLLFRITLLVALPLLVGMFIRARAPDQAERLYKPAMLVSTVSFIAAVVLSLTARQDAVAELGAGTAIAMLLFMGLLMATGWYFGGPNPDYRQVLAVTTNLRNVGLTYVLVDGCCADANYTTAVLAFMALMVPANLVLTIGCGVVRKRRSSGK